MFFLVELVTSQLRPLPSSNIALEDEVRSVLFLRTLIRMYDPYLLGIHANEAGFGF